MAVDFIGKARSLSFRVSDIDAKAARMRHQVKLGSGVGSAQGDTLMLRTIAAYAKLRDSAYGLLQETQANLLQG